MSARDGVQWQCPNRDCNWSFVAIEPGIEELVPRCVCGSVMKKGMVVRTSSYLDFLRDELESPDSVEHEKD